MAFSPDTHWLVIDSADGTARLWPMESEVLIDLACRIAGRNLSHAERDQYFRGEKYRIICPNIPSHFSGMITDAQILVAKGKQLAMQGKIEEAMAAYTEAQKLDSTL